MKHFITLTLFAVICSFSAFAISPIGGTLGACIGGTSSLYEPGADTAGIYTGTWSSSNVAVATVGSTGLVTGISAGTTTITYTDTSGGYVTAIFTVTAAPLGITGGPTSFCVGSGATFSDATPGGTWGSSGGVSITATGSATGVSGGINMIYYSVGTGCHAFLSVTVNATSVASIDTGTIPSMICVGATATIDDATSGGTWSSSTPAIATIGLTTGVVTGVSPGTALISYAITGACGSAFVTATVDISNTTAPVSVSGPTVVYMGEPGITLSHSGTGGGTWSSSAPSTATIGTSSGAITAVALGTTTFTYSATGCGGVVTANQVDTVKNINGISGNVIFSSAHYGYVKVWLITYSPSTFLLEAVDSITSFCSGGTSVYYQFTGMSTDSFRVKAALPEDTTSFTTGYIPTYHDTSFYWHDASVIYFVSGSSNINENINMISGTTASGPGFISGSVLTGANRGTSSSGIPVVGLHMAVLNTTTNTVAGMAYTDGSGNYSFSSLPYGTYTIFPDSVNYATTPYTNITLSATSSSFTAASFIQHTISNTITPIAEAVKNIPVTTSSVSAFPNPTSGKLNIIWNEKAAETGTIYITDVTGRKVYSTSINMNEGNGITAIDLSGLTNGVYMMNIKSASLNYYNKIEVLH